MTDTPHLDQLVLDRYIAGELVGSAALSVETHASACDACAEALRKEALLAVALRETAEAMAGQQRLDRPAARRTGRWLAVGCAAAAAVLVVAVGLRLQPASTEQPSVARTDTDAAVKISMTAGLAFDGPMDAETFDDRMNTPSSTL